jgi:C-terminal processing protease CtpA/Prc
MKRTEVLNAKMTLKFIDKSAYINPGNFSGDEQKYQKFIDSAFVEIKNSNRKNLIIDLRNNAGGYDSFSGYLVSYFADKPFKWNSKFTLKTSQFLKEHTRKHNDTTDAYFQNILTRKNGEIYNYEFDEYQPQSKQMRFNGEVYVLVNRQSHSQSAVTAAQLQDYNFGIIVGEETGDFPTLYASQFQYSLPNTGIVVKVSKGQIVRVNGSEKQEGVIPDIIIKDHLLDDEDEILNGILNKLNEKY